MGLIRQIPEPELAPFSEHDEYTATDYARDDYRRRTINVLAAEIEELVEANAQRRLEQSRPAKWKV